MNSQGKFRSEALRQRFPSSLTMELIDLIQWPAMAATLLAAWLVGFESRYDRRWGFWIFVLSNVLWIIWGLHDGAWALIALQMGLFVLNVRNIRKSQPAPSPAT